jgi:hypothetical protein
MPLGHTCTIMSPHMVESHNTLIPADITAYSQALGMKPGLQDAADLHLYCQMIYQLTHDHHGWKEKHYFLAIGGFAG